MSNSLTQNFVRDLKSRNPEIRGKAAQDLYRYVKTELREVSAEELTSFMDEFNHHIFEMVSGSDVNEKKGGILAIVCLIDADVGNINNRISRFANYLRNLLPSNDIGVMELAAKTVGKLALVSGTYSAQYVEFEVKRAFEWLGGDRHEGKRHAAVLVLRELAVSVPTYFFQQVQMFFDLIFNAIRDPKPIIREAAVEALRAALVVTAQRETAKQTQKPQWYKQCYDEAKNGFDDTLIREKGVNRDDRVHGSLLVLNELMRCSNAQWERSYEDLMQRLQYPITTPPSDSVSLLPRLKSPLISSKTRQNSASHTNISSIMLANNKSNPEHMLFESSVCRSLMIEHFDDICRETLAQRISRTSHILQTLLAILPRLAAFNKEKFVKTHLNPTMVYLLATLRGRERDRAPAFTTIGLIAVAVEKNIKPYLSKIMEIIRASLPTKDTPSKKRTSGLEPSVFVCITLLGHAVKTLIKSDVKDLLEPMLATGLSPALTTSLRELATSIPQLKPDISEGGGLDLQNSGACCGTCWRRRRQSTFFTF